MLLATIGRFHKTSGKFHDERQHNRDKTAPILRHVLALEGGPIFQDVEGELEIMALGGP